uniref:Immunoglobulin I-set domain protein n=1 Tax=Panagrellus redivivus TaxID=6233 RepID=A0A7E4ZRG5_PANRE
MYVCRATNNYGTQDRSTQVFVVGLEAPVLGTLPPEMQVLEDSDVRIECIVVMGIPAPERIWLKDGKPVREDMRIFFDGDGSIVIKSATPEDEGAYTCQARNVVGSASQMTRVSMISRPRIPESAQLRAELGVTPGESLDVPCPVVGNPAPKIVWLLNGHLIDPNHDEYEITPESTLRIKNANRMHTGTFTCKAVNAAGEASIDTRVSVLTPPAIAPGQTSFNHVQGDSIVLPCEVDGEPAPEITWTLNGAPAPGEIDSSGSLIIDNITEEHKGEYRCIARNSVGTDESAANVTVHTAPIIDGSDVPKTLVVKVNDTAILPCPARATPPPLRTWMYEGERIELPPEAAHIVEVRDDGALVLKAAQLEHEGIYECHVSNLAGEDSVIYQLRVQDPPKIISDVPGSFDIVLGLRLDIPCRAIGTPRPVVSWQKDGFEIINNPDAEVDPSGTLHIAASTLASEGQYRCVARNPAGEDARTTNVLVREAPMRTPSQTDEYTHIEGETAKLKCDVKATPAPVYRWFIGDTEITADTPRHALFPDGTLEVTQVGKADNVVYRCQAENSAGQVDIPIRLAVITAPEITDPDMIEYESVKENDPFSLYCPVTSHPLPQINWEMNARPLVADDNVVFSDDKRRLRVLKSKVSDAGVYKCLARNPAGEAAKTFQVEVLVPPQKNDSLHGTKITVFEHQPVTMGCPVSGIPTPTIEWYVNMVVLKAGETKNGVTVSEDGETITIPNALVEHQGTFTCVATSKAGSLPVDIELTVLGESFLE